MPLPLVSMEYTHVHDIFDSQNSRYSEDEPLLSDSLSEDDLMDSTRLSQLKGRWRTAWIPLKKLQDRHALPTNSTSPQRRYCSWIGLLVLLVSLTAYFMFGYFYFRAVSLPVPSHPDKTTDGSARFLTLNIFMRPPGIKNNKDDYKNERLEYIIHHILPHYDVVAIQEAFAAANRRIDRLRIKAREMGFNYEVASTRHFPWQLAVDGGLLLLSRFPIIASHTIEFPRGVHSDWFSFKGALHAHIVLNKTHTLHIFTTHTQASYEKQGFLNQDDTRVRLKQFSLVHDFIANTVQLQEKQDNRTLPVLLLGDFNIDAAEHKGIRITDHAVKSSEPYLLMMDVLTGVGIHNGTELASSWHLYPLKDQMYETFGYHAVTFGDIVMDDSTGDILPSETVLTHGDQLQSVQSIDRVLFADRGSKIIHINSVQIEKFLVSENMNLTDDERESIAFTQISDHYGVSFDVVLS